MSRRGLAVLTLALGLVACSPKSATSGPDATALLRDAAEKSQGVQAFHFKLDFTGAYTADNPPVASAEGDIHRPSDVNAVGLVRSGSVLLEIRLISVGGQLFIKSATGGWQQIPPALAAGVFSPSALFASETGLFAILPKGTQARVTGAEGGGEDATDRIETRFTTDQIAAFLPGVLRGQPLQAKLWIGRQDHRLRRAVLSGRMYDAQKDTGATVELGAFDKPVRIERPIAP
jgi:lipoprotein LprG